MSQGFVTTYNDTLPQVRKVIYDLWPRLHADGELKLLFPGCTHPGTTTTLTRHTGTNNFVAHHPLLEPPPPPSPLVPRGLKVVKCGNPVCILCPIPTTETTVRSRLSKRKHRIYGEFTCHTQRLVYTLSLVWYTY